MPHTDPLLESKPPKSLRAKLRLAALIFVGILFAVFAMVNAEKASVNLLFAKVETPLFLLMIGVFVLGGVAGWLVRGGRKRA